MATSLSINTDLNLIRVPNCFLSPEMRALKASQKSTSPKPGTSKSSSQPQSKLSGSLESGAAKSGMRVDASRVNRRKPTTSPGRTSRSAKPTSGASKTKKSTSSTGKKTGSGDVRRSRTKSAQKETAKSGQSKARPASTRQPSRRGKSPQSTRTVRSQKSKTRVKKNTPLVISGAFWAAKLNQLRVKTRQIWINGRSAGKRAKSRLVLRLNKPQVQLRGRKRTVQPVRGRRKHKGEHVRLAGAVEHRCPYCLEIVETNDPRGVHICPVCGTHHHADCWAVTGTCQVPHD